MTTINWNPPSRTNAEIEEYLGDHSGLCRVDRSRMSRLMAEQLVHGIITRTLDPFAVTDVLQALEGHHHASAAVDPRPFSHPPLAGLMHVHFFQAVFIAKNVALELSSKKGGRRFEDSIKRTETAPDADSVNKIAHEATIGAFERRALHNSRGLTGEWIIYAEHCGQRFYLCVAGHEEGDQLIYDRMIRRCEDRFRTILVGATQ